MSSRAPAAFELLSSSTASVRRGAAAGCPAARSQGWRSAGCSCARVPRDQPVISGTVDPLIRVVMYTKRHRGSMRMSRAVPVPGRRFQSQELSARSRSRKLDQLAIDAIDRGPHSLQQLGGVHLGYTVLDHASSPRRGRAVAAGWHLGSGAASAARRSAVRSCPELSELSDPAVRCKPLSRRSKYANILFKIN